jgi:hypothetical protein
MLQERLNRDDIIVKQVVFTLLVLTLIFKAIDIDVVFV